MWGLVYPEIEKDFALAQLALKLGYKDDYERYLKRSQDYRNIFDTESGWMRPKDVNGNWNTPFDPYVNGHGFVESSAVQATWYIPQDLPGRLSQIWYRTRDQSYHTHQSGILPWQRSRHNRK